MIAHTRASVQSRTLIAHTRASVQNRAYPAQPNRAYPAQPLFRPNTLRDF